MATIHFLKKHDRVSKTAYNGEIFSIEFYVLQTGEIPSEDWLNSASIALQAKFAALFTRLGDHGKIWNEQKFKHLSSTAQLFEFKASDGRIICFFFSGKRVILTHGFTKTSKKTPKREIERAEIYKQDFERRVKNEEKK